VERAASPVKVVLLTTGRPPDALTASRVGILATVAKPVGQNELHDALEGVLTSPAPAALAAGAAPAPAPVSPGPAPAAAPAATRGRILVVEDNTTNQMVAMGLLSRLGYDAEVVSNGRQGVEAVAKSHYDAVLMDCNMPVMDGYEATAAIRHLEGDGRRTLIVAMTASALAGDRERCLAAGMDDYVAKPVKLADLARILPGDAAGTLPPATAAVDAAQLESLRILDGGDGAFLASVVESFAVSSLHALAAIAAAVEAGDPAALVREAHALKGEASTVGAGTVVALCEELESMGAPLDVPAARDLLDRVEAEMSLVRAALQAELDAASAA
jgi:two-component system sensor histidine kinase/response regulator